MKEVNNYKNIRRKPYIYGFSTTNAIVFFIISIILILTIVFGFSFKKLMTISIIGSINYLLCKGLSNGTLLNKLFDKPLPKEISNLSETQED